MSGPQQNPAVWEVIDDKAINSTEPYDELADFTLICQIIFNFAFVSGGVMSFTLLYLVLFHTTGSFKPYSRMLIMCCISDIMYWFLDHMLHQNSRQIDGVFLITLKGFGGYLSYENQMILTGFYIVTLVLTHTTLGAQGFYRYYALVHNKPMSILKTSALFLFTFLSAVPSGIIGYLSFKYSTSVRPGFNYGTLWYKEYPLPVLLVVDVDHIYQKLYYVISASTVTLSYLVSILFAYKSMAHLHKYDHLYSRKTKFLHQKLSKCLLFQNVAPLFVSIIPIMVMVVPLFFRITINQEITIFMIAISLIPAFNSLVTIAIISPYRQYILNLFRCPSRVLRKPMGTSVTLNESGKM
ncbi:unnamed protein product [Bursaphelenchus xylophilus]|uniref:(pine wood nematode) hypothetical protein n=1 Tax=Bursaphelenchus xylophilus TaxID=6326 RepID=A0A1I7S5L2_BURXY|nr:unnamed protein product [Bursaphelenchus xylophilus]CAG9124830.1 unnamed protein product [Bursaphelenchus xylophilus]